MQQYWSHFWIYKWMHYHIPCLSSCSSKKVPPIVWIQQILCRWFFGPSEIISVFVHHAKSCTPEPKPWSWDLWGSLKGLQFWQPEKNFEFWFQFMCSFGCTWLFQACRVNVSRFPATSMALAFGETFSRQVSDPGQVRRLRFRQMLGIIAWYHIQWDNNLSMNWSFHTCHDLSTAYRMLSCLLNA